VQSKAGKDKLAILLCSRVVWGSQGAHQLMDGHCSGQTKSITLQWFNCTLYT